MKNLDNSIRRHQWRLEEERRKVAELETLIARLKTEIRQVEASLIGEQQIGTRNTEVVKDNGVYASDIGARRANLMQSLKGLEIEMVQATDDVSTAFQEFKRCDLMRARNQEKVRQKMKRVQESEFDKAAL